MVIECVYLCVNQTRALKYNEHLVMTKIQMYWTMDMEKVAKKGANLQSLQVVQNSWSFSLISFG